MRIGIVGVRGATNPPEQWKFVEENGIHMYRMRDVARDGIEAVVADALDKVTDGVDAFYVSWDSDVVDAAFDQPALISHRLACYFIFHLLGGWAIGGSPT